MESTASAVIERGLLMLRQGRYQETADLMKSLLSTNPQHAFALHLLANCQYHLSNQQNQALNTINQAISLEPFMADHFSLKGLILNSLNQNKEALISVDEAIELQPEFSQAHAVKAYILLQMSRWADAENSARTALQHDPENLFAGNLLATSLHRQNKLSEYEHLVSDLLAKDPEDALSHSNAGWVYIQKKDYNQAQNHFREALRLDPMFEPARMGMIETFKTKSYIYRLYLRYTLFMSRLNKQSQVLFIISIFFGFRLLRSVTEKLPGSTGKILTGTLIIGYILFFFWTWVSNGIGHLIVWTDKNARLALKKDEVLDGLFVGGFVLLGLVLLALGAIINNSSWLILGGTLLATAIPLSCFFLNQHPKGRILYLSISCLIALSGMLALTMTLIAEAQKNPFFKITIAAGFLSFIVTTWLGAFGFLKK